MGNLKRQTSKSLYFFSIFVAISFFVLSILIGNYVNYVKTKEISQAQEEISRLFNLSLIEKDKNVCEFEWQDIWEEKVAIGEILSELEARFGKENENIAEQKKIYHNVQVQTIRTVEEIIANCDKDWEVVLFFYTNDRAKKEYYQKSEIQGAVLNTVYLNNPEKIKIFAFDLDLEGSDADEIIRKYNITFAPTLIIKDKAYGGLVNRNEIQKILLE